MGRKRIRGIKDAEDKARPVWRDEKRREEADDDSDRSTKAEGAVGGDGRQSERLCGTNRSWPDISGFKQSVIGGILGQLIDELEIQLTEQNADLKRLTDKIARLEARKLELEALRTQIDE